MDETTPFTWNAEEALKLLDRGFKIVLFKDGLGDVTAIACPSNKNIERAVSDWRNFDDLPDKEYETEEESMRDIQRSVFAGPNKFAGGGRSVSEALHCLTEKAVFNRLPDGNGDYFTPPPPEEK